ncbi:FAA hydrolase family protein [Nocardia panacis]|uniref:FAA hydrolase family protein n=2 Tax=Nocardia panacis TaxID=2340916 RepID=A0A3A4KD25_9NOCA|nr:FAA hydrolase family protein [Nocardia panacis]
MNLRIVSFADGTRFAPGVMADDDTIVPLAPVLEKHGIHLDSTRQLLGLWPHLRILIGAELDSGGHRTLSADSVRLGPPVPDPGQIIAVGFNYDTHSEGFLLPRPAETVVFTKSPTSLSGPHDPVVKPAISMALDYEAEIALVIGRPGYRIDRADAATHIAGYMLANDITARDVALPGGFDSSPLQAQIVRGKGYPTFCPTGPWLLPAEGAPESFEFELSVNDELRQSGSTRDMMLGFAEIIASVSASIALATGDIILTGTPSGCGFQCDPPRYLMPGDVITARSDLLGAMRLPVVEESALPDPTARQA